MERKTEIEREEELGQNKMLFSFGVELPMAKPLIAGSPTLCQGDRSPATRRLPALKNQINSDTFFVASLNAFCSTFFCWSSSLLFSGKFDCWSSYRWCNIDGRGDCCRLVKMVLVEWADEFSKVLDRWGWLSGIFFLWIPFPRHQVVEA